MGLESHIHRVLDRETELTFGHDYWFFDGLRTETLEIAEEIARVLDKSGEFGETEIVNLGDENTFGMDGGARIRFGVWKKK